MAHSIILDTNAKASTNAALDDALAYIERVRCLPCSENDGLVTLNADAWTAIQTALDGAIASLRHVRIRIADSYVSVDSKSAREIETNVAVRDAILSAWNLPTAALNDAIAAIDRVRYVLSAADDNASVAPITAATLNANDWSEARVALEDAATAIDRVRQHLLAADEPGGMGFGSLLIAGVLIAGVALVGAAWVALLNDIIG